MQQITDKLYLGNLNDALLATMRGDFDVIVYLGQEIHTKLCFNCEPVCIHIPLNDGKNGISKIRKALFVIYMISISNDKILIACRAGISRSILVTAAIFALTRKIGFDEAYEQIARIATQSQPEQHLLQEIKKVTEELKCCI